MANDFYNDQTGNSAPNTKVGKGSKGTVTEKAINWPGLPGKSGPERSAGTKKTKTKNVSKGI